MSPGPVTRFPLSWPQGWTRTPLRLRRRAAFRTGHRELSVYDALRRLSGELARLGAVDEQLSTNVPVRLDGLPRSGQPEPSDPGAAVYFLLKGQTTVLACDKWTRVADNVAAIAQHIDALRRIDRYGVGTLEQAFRGYTALPENATPAGASTWWRVLDLSPDASLDEIESSYRLLARECHPDAGGNHDAMALLNWARDEARRARGK